MLSKKDQMKNLFHTLDIYVPSTLNREKKLDFCSGKSGPKSRIKIRHAHDHDIDPLEWLWNFRCPEDLDFCSGKSGPKSRIKIIHAHDHEHWSVPWSLKNMEFMYTWNVPPKGVSTHRSVEGTYAWNISELTRTWRLSFSLKVKSQRRKSWRMQRLDRKPCKSISIWSKNTTKKWSDEIYHP